jgi:hypothetical protein
MGTLNNFIIKVEVQNLYFVLNTICILEMFLLAIREKVEMKIIISILILRTFGN